MNAKLAGIKRKSGSRNRQLRGADGTTGFAGLEHELTNAILGIYFQVYNELGFAFAEVIYASAMCLALEQAGFEVDRELAIRVSFRGHTMGVFRADLVVNRKIILELKISDEITKAHDAQLTHYLRATAMEIGLILAFGATPRYRRIEFLNKRKCLAAPPE